MGLNCGGEGGGGGFVRKKKDDILNVANRPHVRGIPTMNPMHCSIYITKLIA